MDYVNPLKQRLASGQVATMAMITMPGVAAMQVWASGPLDGVIIDLEHGPIGIESAHAMIAATRGTTTAPIVRVPWNVPWVTKPLLDAGAMGVVFPMIGDADDARAAVASLRYPPTGERGWGPFYAHMRWGQPIPDYMRHADDELLAMITIERPDAIDNLEEIVRVPGIDMLIIAPFDLSVLMGHPGNPGHPEVQRAIATAEETILASGIPLCGVALNAETGNRLIDKGYRCLFLGFDWMILQRAVNGLTEGMRLDR
jgi:4-hydroxy-2-oxoheptanedioate aldolase